MKAIKQIIGRLTVGCLFALGLVNNMCAQNNKGDIPPFPGTYYSAKDFEWKPPLPFNPHPELEAVEIEPGIFLIDDTMIPDTPEQAEARQRWQEADALAKAIAADPVLAQAAREAAAEATRAAKEALQKRIQEEFVPWLHVEATLSDGSKARFADQAQERMVEVTNQIGRLTAKNASDLEAGKEDAALFGLSESGTNQLGRPLALHGRGAGFITSFNTESADTISTDEVQPGGSTGLSLTGTNTIIGLWEAGLVFTNHQEFTNGGRRVFLLETNSPYGVIDHSTHVAGTLAAKGITNAAKGMAFQAEI